MCFFYIPKANGFVVKYNKKHYSQLFKFFSNSFMVKYIHIGFVFIHKKCMFNMAKNFPRYQDACLSFVTVDQ